MSAIGDLLDGPPRHLERYAPPWASGRFTICGRPLDDVSAPNLFAVDDAEGEDPTPIRPDDAPEVWVYEGDEQPANPDAFYLGSE